MRKAFTLIEVFVAMGLVVILSTAGIGALRRNSQRKAVENAASDLASVMRKAQTYAASGVKVNCTILGGWQVTFSGTQNYQLSEVCEDPTGGVHLVQSGVLPPNVTFTTSTTAPILFKVLGQGVTFGSNTYIQPISISGYSVVKTITVNEGGEITLVSNYVFPSPTPTPAGVCTLVSRCSSSTPGETVSYIPTNPPTCTVNGANGLGVPQGLCAGSYTGGCTQGTNSCVCRQYKTCCTTALGFAGSNCQDLSLTTIFSTSFGSQDSSDVPGWAEVELDGTARTDNISPLAGSPTQHNAEMSRKAAIIKIIDARGYKDLQLEFQHNWNTTYVDYCTGIDCSAYTRLATLPNEGQTTWKPYTYNLYGADNKIVKIKFSNTSNGSNLTRIDDVYLKGVVDPSSPPPDQSQQLMWTESFGTTNNIFPPGWDSSNTNNVRTSSTTPLSGSPTIPHVRLNNGTREIRRILLNDYKNLVLKYYWYVGGGPSSDSLQVQYCVDNCSTYTTLATYTATNVWSSEQTFNFPTNINTFDNTVTIKFLCTVNGSAGGSCRIDDVSIYGIPYTFSDNTITQPSSISSGSYYNPTQLAIRKEDYQ